MGRANESRIKLPRAFCLAVAAAALVSLVVVPTPRLRAQEAGTPPETSAPESDAAQPEAETQEAAPDQQSDQEKHPDPAQPGAQASPDGTAQAAAPAPEMPKWPINEKPGQATITWDSHGLSIAAANSSLQQILKDVSTATGAKVDGLNGDERVFGAYGPGQARDVLSQLLLGAGYNVIMIGDQGQGAPRQILLTARRAAGDQGAANGNAANNGDDDAADNEAEEQPVQPQPPMRPGFPGGPPRTPQQMMQERQERLQQMRQQQQPQQPQPNNPQN